MLDALSRPYYLSDDLPTAFNQFLLHHLNKHKLEEPCVMINLKEGARQVGRERERKQKSVNGKIRAF